MDFPGTLLADLAPWSCRRAGPFPGRTAACREARGLLGRSCLGVLRAWFFPGGVPAASDPEVAIAVLPGVQTLLGTPRRAATSGRCAPALGSEPDRHRGVGLQRGELRVAVFGRDWPLRASRGRVGIDGASGVKGRVAGGFAGLRGIRRASPRDFEGSEELRRGTSRDQKNFAAGLRGIRRTSPRDFEGSEEFRRGTSRDFADGVRARRWIDTERT